MARQPTGRRHSLSRVVLLLLLACCCIAPLVHTSAAEKSDVLPSGAKVQRASTARLTRRPVAPAVPVAAAAAAGLPPASDRSLPKDAAAASAPALATNQSASALELSSRAANANTRPAPSGSSPVAGARPGALGLSSLVSPGGRANAAASSSLPADGVPEQTLRLLLGEESHAGSIGPAILFGLLRFIGYTFFSLVFALWWGQSSLLYMPTFGRAGESRVVQANPRGFRSPEEYGLRHDEVWLRADDGVRLHAWLVLQPAEAAATAPTLIFFHGNAGNLGFRLPNIKALYYTARCNIFIIDYRGYGNSGGEPSEAGLIADGQAALDYLRTRRSPSGGSEGQSAVDPARLHLFGRSLGGAVALHLAALDAEQHERQSTAAAQSGSASAPPPPLAGVIVENTFASLADMVIVLAARLGLIRAHAAQGPTDGAEPDSAASAAAAASSIQAAVLASSKREPFGRMMWRWLLRVLMTNTWNNLAAVVRVRTPLLFVSGLADELVPAAHMAALYAAAHRAPQRRLHTVEHGTHNDTHVRGGLEYYETIARFFAEAHENATGTAAARQERGHDISVATMPPHDYGATAPARA